MNSLSIVDPSEKLVSLHNSIGLPKMQDTDNMSEKLALIPENPEPPKVRQSLFLIYP